MTDATLLDLVLTPGQLTPLFQPIVRTRDGSTFGFEGLTRGPEGTNLHAADVLFEYVRRKHEESAVDRACVAAILRDASRLPRSAKLSMNVHASTLGRDLGFVAFVLAEADRHRIEHERLVIEIVEHTPFWDGARFLDSLEAFRSAGVAIALDDVGLGHSNYRMILESRPAYFKLDRFLVQGIAADPFRQAVVRSLVQLASAFSGAVIAEGIEDAADLEAIGELGIDLAQGYLFARPAAAAEFMEKDC